MRPSVSPHHLIIAARDKEAIARVALPCVGSNDDRRGPFCLLIFSPQEETGGVVQYAPEKNPRSMFEGCIENVKGVSNDGDTVPLHA